MSQENDIQIPSPANVPITTLENIVEKTESLQIDEKYSDQSHRVSQKSPKSEKNNFKSQKKRIKKPVKRLNTLTTFKKHKKNHPRNTKNVSTLEQKMNLEAVIGKLMNKIQ